MRNSFSDWTLLVVPGVIWGASFLFIAEGLAAVAPNGVTFTRIAIGFLTLSLFPSARRPVARADWAGTAALGLLWFAFPLSMFPFAEQRISSALAGMLNGAVPLSAAIVASFIARQLPSRHTAKGLAVGLAGAVLMALPTIGEPSSAAGVLMVVAAIASYGFAPNIARPLQQKYGALPVELKAEAVQTVSPTLGQDSLRAAVIAGFVGVALVLALMILYYRRLAVVVIVGVAASGALIWTVVSIWGETRGLALTLAGIAARLGPLTVRLAGDLVDQAVADQSTERRVHLPDVERPQLGGALLELLLQGEPVLGSVREQGQQTVPDRHRACTSPRRCIPSMHDYIPSMQVGFVAARSRAEQ